MGAASISSVLVSIITYFQNLGISVDIPNIKLPDSVVKALDSFKEAFNYIISLLPFLPEFDERCLLVLLALGVPFLLDLAYVWFVESMLHMVIHLVDLASILIVGFCLNRIIFFGSNTEIITIVIIFCLYLIVRAGYSFFTRKKSNVTLQEVAHDICTHFMSGIIPHVHSNLSLRELSEKLLLFSGTIQIQAKKSHWYTSVIFGVVGAIFIVGSLIVGGTIPIPGLKIPGSIQVFLPIIGYILGVFMIIMAFMKQTMCGAKCILGFRKFGKRWGLRLLMLALDLLYIPILTGLMNQITPQKVEFAPGTFYRIEYKNTTTDMFESHKYSLANCTTPINSTICEKICKGGSVFVLSKDNSLRLVDDVLQVNGLTILYAVIFVMIGIPCLWYHTIKTNRKFMFAINVWGANTREKWENTIRRMHTTGIFLFAEYKVTRSTWSVVILGLKFICMVISTISSTVWLEAFFLLPVPYFLVFLYIAIKKPYLHRVNNILDSILYIVNFLFTLIPILSNYGIEIPDTFSIVLAAVMFIIPVISLIILLCRFRGDGQYDENDPTVLTKAMKEDIDMDAEEAKDCYWDQRESDDDDDEFARTDEFLLQTGMGENDDMYQNPIFTSSENNVVIEPEMLETIDQSLSRKIANKQNKVAEEKNDKKKNKKNKKKMQSQMKSKGNKKDGKIVVNRYYLASMFEQMFQMLDLVIDGATIESVLKTLNVAVSAAAACFGWYISAMIGQYPDAVLTSQC